MMRHSAIIFGGIGTLVETSDIQRQSFNDAFEKLGIDFYWDAETYRDSLSETGGKQRLSAIRLKNGTKLLPQQIGEVHTLKTDCFVSRISAAHLNLRAGVDELIDHARLNSQKLAWATTTSRANIDAVIKSTRGALHHDLFAFIGNDTCITRQKPDPQIYALCLQALDIAVAQGVAIEDSVMGVAAAKAAGIYTIGFPGEFNNSEDLTSADLVVSNLASLIEVPIQ